MGWINTLESLSIPKTEIYEWAMKYRPEAKSAPSAFDVKIEYDYELLRSLEASK